jgi:hypothetical protein
VFFVRFILRLRVQNKGSLLKDPFHVKQSYYYHLRRIVSIDREKSVSAHGNCDTSAYRLSISIRPRGHICLP